MASKGNQPSAGHGTQRNGGETHGTTSPESPGGEEVPTLSKNEAFDVLRNSRRRTAIACLRKNGGTMSVNELTTCVAAREYDVEPDELTPEQYKRVYTGLYQCHLERADDFGVVDFDAEENTVQLREQAAALDPYLADPEPAGSVRLELAVAAVTALLVTVSAVVALQLQAIPMAVVVGLPITALVGLSLFQLS